MQHGSTSYTIEHRHHMHTRNVTLIRIDISHDSVHVLLRSVVFKVVFGVTV